MFGTGKQRLVGTGKWTQNIPASCRTWEEPWPPVAPKGPVRTLLPSPVLSHPRAPSLEPILPWNKQCPTTHPEAHGISWGRLDECSSVVRRDVRMWHLWACETVGGGEHHDHLPLFPKAQLGPVVTSPCLCPFPLALAGPRATAESRSSQSYNGQGCPHPALL